MSRDDRDALTRIVGALALGSLVTGCAGTGGSSYDADPAAQTGCGAGGQATSCAAGPPAPLRQEARPAETFEVAARELFRQLQRHSTPPRPWTLGVQRLECAPSDHRRAGELSEEFRHRMVGALVRARLEERPRAVGDVVDVEEVTRILAQHQLHYEQWTVYDRSLVGDGKLLPASAFVVARVRLRPDGGESWSFKVVLYEDGSVKAYTEVEVAPPR